MISILSSSSSSNHIALQEMSTKGDHRWPLPGEEAGLASEARLRLLLRKAAQGFEKVAQEVRRSSPPGMIALLAIMILAFACRRAPAAPSPTINCQTSVLLLPLTVHGEDLDFANLSTQSDGVCFSVLIFDDKHTLAENSLRIAGRVEATGLVAVKEAISKFHMIAHILDGRHMHRILPAKHAWSGQEPKLILEHILERDRLVPLRNRTRHFVLGYNCDAITAVTKDFVKDAFCISSDKSEEDASWVKAHVVGAASKVLSKLQIEDHLHMIHSILDASVAASTQYIRMFLRNADSHLALTMQFNSIGFSLSAVVQQLS